MSEKLKKSLWMVAAAGAACGAASSQAATAVPSQTQLVEAVKAFLADHGDLCMAKYTWPRDVTPGDENTDPNDAVQLPVLERLGVVQSVEIPAPKVAAADAQSSAPASAPAAPATRRYSLTEKGRKYYLQ